MTYEEAFIMLFRYKHRNDSGLTHRDATRARRVLIGEFGCIRQWKPRALSTGSPHHIKFLRELAGDMDIDWREFPIFESHDSWIDTKGRPVAATSHSYNLRNEQLRQIVAFADKYDLHVDVNGTGSWKNPECAVIVVFRRYPT